MRVFSHLKKKLRNWKIEKKNLNFDLFEMRGEKSSALLYFILHSFFNLRTITVQIQPVTNQSDCSRANLVESALCLLSQGILLCSNRTEFYQCDRLLLSCIEGKMHSVESCIRINYILIYDANMSRLKRLKCNCLKVWSGWITETNKVPEKEQNSSIFDWLHVNMAATILVVQLSTRSLGLSSPAPACSPSLHRVLIVIIVFTCSRQLTLFQSEDWWWGPTLEDKGGTATRAQGLWLAGCLAATRPSAILNSVYGSLFRKLDGCTVRSKICSVFSVLILSWWVLILVLFWHF